MSNKPAFSGNDIVSALTKKGFEEGRGDHVHLFLMVNGQRTFIRTKVSRGRKAYTDGLLKCVSSQMKLSTWQAVDFIKCELNYDEYIDFFRQKNILT